MKYADMLKDVLGEVEGCPEDVAADAMRKACIQWCRETYCLTTSMSVTTTEGAESQVDLTAVWPVAILSARVNGKEVSVLAANDPATADCTDDDPAIVYANPEQPYVVPPPTVPVDVELYLAVAPGQESDEVPDFLWQRYSEDLTNGALWRLFSSRAKPWSDAKSAQDSKGLFDDAIKKEAAHLGVNRLTSATRLRVTPI